MSWLLSVLFLWFSAQIGCTVAACSWTQSAGRIPGGVLQDGINTVDGCKARCLATSGCQSVDFNNNNECYLQNTQSGVVSSNTVTHYDYVCTDPCIPNPCQNGGTCSSSSNSYTCACTSAYTGTNCETAICRKVDIIQDQNIQNAITTNYAGNLNNVKGFPSGVYWTIPLPSFSITWPLILELNPPDEVRYATSANLDYIRVAIFYGSNGYYLSPPCFASPCKLDHKLSVTKITIYFAPTDFTQNVSVTNVQINYCKIYLLGFCYGLIQVILDSVFTLLDITTLGLLQLDQGRANFTAKIDIPYVQVDLNIIGRGVSEFNRVELTQYYNIKSGTVEIWNQGVAQTIHNSNGDLSNSLTVDPVTNSNFAIDFYSGIEGDKIQVDIVPDRSPDQSTTTRLNYQNLHILIC